MFPRAGKSENRLRPLWRAMLDDCALALAWSPSGQHVAFATASGPVRIFTADGKTAADLPGHGFGTTALAWKPNGELLATCGQDGSIRLYDAALWHERAKLDGGAAWVERLAFHPSGELLASAAGKKLRLWDAAGHMTREYAGHPGTIADLAWKPNANLLAAAAYGGVSLYDPAEPEATAKYAFRGAPLAVAWSPNGAMLAHGNQDATVHFWYSATGEELEMSGYPTKVTALSWDYSSRYLATGGGSKVCIWDCGGKGPRGGTPQMLELHAEPLAAVAWQRRGFLLASGGRDGIVALWQPAVKQKPLVGRDEQPGEVASLAWSPDDTALAVGFDSGAVAVYRV